MLNVEKGDINKNFCREMLDKKFPITIIERFYDTVKSASVDFEKNNYLELSYKYTPAYKILLDDFKEGTFFANDPFECMLMYHLTKQEDKKLHILNYKFSQNRLSTLDFFESFDFIFSILGMTFEQLYELLPTILSFLKVNGILAFKVPAYWFYRDALTDMEKTVLDYSQKNDKKWLFLEPLTDIIEKNGASLIKEEKDVGTFVTDRKELAYLSSLNKLFDSIIKNNTAHLEVANIQKDDIELRSAVLIIQKNKKSITKDNLFNL